jgi:hypothetical protein
MDQEHEIDFLLQRDMRRFIERDLPNQQWLTLHHFWFEDRTHGGIFCALVPLALVDRALSHDSWDLTVGHSIGPRCTQYFEEGKKVTEYYRFGDRDGIEPLVIPRDFHGVRPDYVEILEEFRLFHQLYWDAARGVYLKFDEAGNPHEVIRIKANRVVEVSKLHIRQFLALKGAVLVVFFDSVRNSTLDIEAVPEPERRVEVRNDDCRYHVNAVRDDRILSNRWRSFSRLCGKRVIRPLPPEQSGFWPFDDQPEEYPEFIIAVDQDGKPVRYSCNHEQLANYFGANSQAPHYLTPVYFRKEVLSKYYDNPNLYSVEDGYLRCGSLWGLRMDNNLPDHVVVYLGDLGRDLPASERPYWQSFNTLPERGISKTAWSRDFMAEFAEPVRVDLRFRYKYSSFNRAWAQKFSWPFFLPLHGAEQHLARIIRSLLNDSQAEFDGQVLALTKLLVDSLNEKELGRLASDLPAGAKGIDKLEAFLSKQGFPNVPEVVGLLRDLQDIRSSGAAHRKGSRYERVIAEQGIATRSLPAVFDEILENAITALDSLAAHFLPPSPQDAA